MREQKYANVLEKYEEEHQKKNKPTKTNKPQDDQKENAEKLSSTREIKYQKVQDEINKTKKTTKKKMIEEELDELQNTPKTSTKKASSKSSSSKPSAKTKTTSKKVSSSSSPSRKSSQKTTEKSSKAADSTPVKIEQVSGSKDLDDIYLTSSFKPFKKRFKVSKLIFSLIKVIIFFAILGAIGYFVAYPLYKFYLSSKPQNIFISTIDYATDRLISSQITEDNPNANIHLKLNNNQMILQLLGGFDYAINASNLQLSNAANNNKNYDIYYHNKKIYYSPQSVDTTINSSSQLTETDFKYIVNKTSEILKSLIIPEKLSKEADEITVNGKTIKVIRNTYEIDKETAEIITKRYYDAIRNDNKLIAYLAQSNNKTISEYKDYLQRVNIKYSDQYKTAINIYVSSKAQFVGLDYEKNGFRIFYYYQDNNDFNSYLNLNGIKTCSNEDHCLANDNFILEVNGTTQENNITNFNVLYNNKNIANFKLTNFKMIK